jgi:peroxiredoxin
LLRRHRHTLATLLLALLLPLLAGCNIETSPGAAASRTPVAGGSNTANLKIDPDASITGAPQVAVGASGPDFSLPGVDGSTYSLSAEKGKVVVLEFIATWCPHCQADAPMMNRLDAKYKPKGVQIFAINSTPRGHNNSDPAAMSDLQWFHDSYTVTFPLLFDTELKSANDYGVSFYPSIYIVDKQGKVAFQPPDNELPSNEELSVVIDKLLGP